MKTTRSLLIALLTATSLLVPVASQAKTIFERFAPPLLPIPVPVPVPSAVYIHGGDVRELPPRYYEGERRYERDPRYDRRDWREDRRDWHHDRHDYYHHDHYDHDGRRY